MDKSLTKVRVHLRPRQKLLRATIADRFLKSYAIIVLDLSKWETVGLMSKSITIFGMYLTRPGMVHFGCTSPTQFIWIIF